MDMRPPGVGSMELESPVEDAREVVLDQPSKVKKNHCRPPTSYISVVACGEVACTGCAFYLIFLCGSRQ